MRVKFGPTVAQFRGEAKLAYDHAVRRCTIEGRGVDSRGASRTNAGGVVEDTGAATTLLKVEGNFTVTGPLETFANAGGVHLARAILAEFAGNAVKLVTERAPAAGAATELVPSPLAEEGNGAGAAAVPHPQAPGDSSGHAGPAAAQPRPAFWFKPLLPRAPPPHLAPMPSTRHNSCAPAQNIGRAQRWCASNILGNSGERLTGPLRAPDDPRPPITNRPTRECS
jgi:hypothetical protein